MGSCSTNRILFCSDIHCGKGYRRECVLGLIDLYNTLVPDAVVVAGDLTFRARKSQFEEGRDILKHLGPKILLIPGNHDIPLYDIIRRVSDPFRYWQDIYNAIGAVSELSFPNIKMLGINTVVPLTHQKAVLTPAEKARITKWNKANPVGSAPWRGIVMHQQLFNLPGHYRPGKIWNAPSVVEYFKNHQVDFVLYGHVHYPLITDARKVFRSLQSRILLISSGTVSNKRTRGPNSANTVQMLEASPTQLAVTTYTWDDTKKQFLVTDTQTFMKNETGPDPCRS